MVIRARPLSIQEYRRPIGDFSRLCAPFRPTFCRDMSFDQLSLIKFGRVALQNAARRSPLRRALNVEPNELTALAELHRAVKNGQIVLRKADKGRQIVLLNKCDYVRAVEKLLCDTANYKRVPFNGKYRAGALAIACVKRLDDTFSEYLKKDLLLFTD